MPLPRPTSGLGPAATDLGLGSLLQDQVQGETEEQRKKRMAELAQRQLTGTPATNALFPGGFGGYGA